MSKVDQQSPSPSSTKPGGPRVHADQTVPWVLCSERLPEFNQRVVAYLKGRKWHSENWFTRDGWAFMVRHDSPFYTHGCARWGLDFYDKALKSLDADELEVIQWIPLERPS